MLKNSLSTELNAVMNAQNEQSHRNIEKNKLFISLINDGAGHKLGMLYSI